MKQQLTRKQQAFVRYLLANPKASATEAANQTYSVANRGVAGTIAVENMQKPAIMAVLEKHDLKAQKVLAEGLQATKGIYANGEKVDEEIDHQVRLRAADSILDRLHGKATQRVEQHSTSVNLNLSLNDIT